MVSGGQTGAFIAAKIVSGGQMVTLVTVQDSVPVCYDTGHARKISPNKIAQKINKFNFFMRYLQMFLVIVYILLNGIKFVKKPS